MNAWIPLISSRKDEIIHRDGPGAQATDGPCNSCAQFSPLFRCSECFSNELLCQACIISSHALAPFHHIQVSLLPSSPSAFLLINICLSILNQEWNGHYFKQTSLQKLGLHIQLGHNGAPCPSPNISTSLSTILHTNGIHSVHIDHCTCHQGHNIGITAQFLRLGLWPAKIQRQQPPSSSSTSIISSPFRVKSTSMIFIGPYLILCQMPTIQSFQYVVFVSGAHDLSHIILPLQYRYIELSRCVRQFRHIMLIKRGGLGHSPLPLSSSSPGSCAVECPCCPHPGRNIPDSWRYVNSENK